VLSAEKERAHSVRERERGGASPRAAHSQTRSKREVHPSKKEDMRGMRAGGSTSIARGGVYEKEKSGYHPPVKKGELLTTVAHSRVSTAV